MTNDHKLGFPPIAEEAARVADYPEHRDGVDYYPFGIPARVLQESEARMAKLCEDLRGETAEQLAFRKGDHKEDGLVSDGVTDNEIVKGVDRNMRQLNTQAELRAFYMAVSDRLTPLRSRKLLDLIGVVYGGHIKRIDSQDRAKKTIGLGALIGGANLTAGNPFVPSDEQLAKEGYSILRPSEVMVKKFSDVEPVKHGFVFTSGVIERARF